MCILEQTESRIESPSSTRCNSSPECTTHHRADNKTGVVDTKEETKTIPAHDNDALYPRQQQRIVVVVNNKHLLIALFLFGS